MVIVCHHCQTENVNDAEKCASCGTIANNTVEMQALPDNNEDVPMTDNADFGDKLDQTQFVSEDELENEVSTTSDSTSLNPIVEVDLEEDAVEEDILRHGDDETHATSKMPNMSDDDDGLLHIGSVRFRGNLLLTDKQDGTIYRIENELLNEAIVGRLNAKTGFRPQLDFTESNGKERGVSRRHATINQRGDLIFVTDHNSLNGTFLNGQRLVPEQARVVRDSDTLRIGHITLIVAFERLTRDS